MGGMQTWMWGQTWPQMMDALVPMASQPTEMSSRNWMMRRLLVDERLSAAQTADANDFIYQWQSSADYNAALGLSKIQAPVLAINSADDERNPPETGRLEASMKELKHAQLLLIPASADTRGHGTTSMAKFYSKANLEKRRQTRWFRES